MTVSCQLCPCGCFLVARRTSLLVQLLQDLSDDLTDTLQSLDVVLGYVKVVLQALDL